MHGGDAPTREQPASELVDGAVALDDLAGEDEGERGLDGVGGAVAVPQAQRPAGIVAAGAPASPRDSWPSATALPQSRARIVTQFTLASPPMLWASPTRGSRT